MDDALGVRDAQRVGELDADVEHLGDLHRPAGHALAERLAAQQLHHDERRRLVHADVVDGADAGMAQGAGRAGFEPESIERLLILDGVGGQDLQRHLPAQPFVLGQIHDAHPARAERPENPIVREGLSDHPCGASRLPIERQV